MTWSFPMTLDRTSSTTILTDPPADSGSTRDWPTVATVTRNCLAGHHRKAELPGRRFARPEDADGIDPLGALPDHGLVAVVGVLRQDDHDGRATHRRCG